MILIKTTNNEYFQFLNLIYTYEKGLKNNLIIMKGLKKVSKVLIVLMLLLTANFTFAQNSANDTSKIVAENKTPEECYKTAINELATCGELMKAYNRTKAIGYASTIVSVYALKSGINYKNNLLIATGSIGTAFGVFLIMGSENKFVEIGNKFKKISVYLSPTKLKIKF